MGKDGFDASLGLAFSLELFKRYRKSGVLRCEIRRVPGFRGPGIAYLELIEGAVVASYVEDKTGQRYPISKNTLIQLDKEKGPFEWRLSASSPALQQIIPPALPPGRSTQPYPGNVSITPLPSDTSIPIIIAPLHSEQLLKWTLAQQQILQLVWNAIDGRRSIRDIKMLTRSSLSETTVDEVLHMFIQWKVVAIVA